MSMAQNSLFWTVSLLAASAILQGCANVPVRPTAIAPSYALTDVSGTTWGRHFPHDDNGLQTLSGFHVLQAGVDGLAARVQIIRRAERTLDLQYFIFRGDATGSLIRQE